MEKTERRAYAKINLGLDVLRRRENGYHDVKMVMQTVGIYDELTFEKIKEGIIVTTDKEELPTDKGNLIYRAAELLTEKYQIREGIRISLKKNIPIAAGMAGGSTDAAAQYCAQAACSVFPAALQRARRWFRCRTMDRSPL